MGCGSSKKLKAAPPKSIFGNVTDPASSTTAKPDVQLPVQNEPEVQPTGAVDSLGQPETGYSEAGDGVKKAVGEVESPVVESKLENNQTEVVVKASATEQKEEKNTTPAATEVNPAEANATEFSPAQKPADADSADSDSGTEAEAKAEGPPLLTIDGDRILRHSDNAKKLFAQLAHSEDLKKQIARKDFVQYFRNQGAANLTCRRLYSKFNPQNSAFMNYDEFQANLVAHTQKAGEED